METLIAQQVEPVELSYTGLILHYLGPVYAILILASGLAVFIGAVLSLRKRPHVTATYLVFVPMPFMIGLFATVQRGIEGCWFLANSGAAPKPPEMALFLAAMFLPILLGLLVTFPGYLVTAVGLFVRTLSADRPSE